MSEVESSFSAPIDRVLSRMRLAGVFSWAVSVALVIVAPAVGFQRRYYWKVLLKWRVVLGCHVRTGIPHHHRRTRIRLGGNGSCSQWAHIETDGIVLVAMTIEPLPPAPLLHLCQTAALSRL
eukprot:scaffold8893_cov48-Attheya_sp.AAC.4